MSLSEADRFAAAYTALRKRERWAERDRARRAASVAAAVEWMRGELGAGAHIVDVGSGPTRVPGVVGIDLIHGADVRADMTALPFCDASVDGVLYAASLHYAPLDESIREAARVLRAAGLLMALDSPVYRGDAAIRRAVHRSAAYYESMGQPALEAHYHPVEVGDLRNVLDRFGFEVLRLSAGSRWRRLLRRGPSSAVVARRLR